MLLLSTVMAFRGESSRILEFSDLFLSEIVVNEIGEGFHIPVSITKWASLIRTMLTILPSHTIINRFLQH